MAMLTDEEVAAVVALEADAAWPPWTKPAESTSRVGYCLSAEGKFGRVHIAVENRYDAAFICAMRNMWPRLLSDREESAKRIRDLETALDNTDAIFKEQAARIKALEAERAKDGHGFKTFCGCTGCTSIRSTHTERDALRAEIKKLRGEP